jgi:hydrogenase maturation protein HypF
MSQSQVAIEPAGCRAERIRVRGIVQGVGFRPTVWRIANALGVRGSVGNDGEGVLIEAWAEPTTLEMLIERIWREAPSLARIDRVERSPLAMSDEPYDFRIVASGVGPARTQVAPDAAVCAACTQETLDPFGRRFRYPFTNCTHCGPRLSIVEGIPYDRENTTMVRFSMCATCAAEYENPADRRFHAQPIACHTCGPRVTLARSDGRALALEALTFLDAADAGCTLLQREHIVAIQGLGGYQLACDATSKSAVARLRSGKKRERKPFALMARDLDVIRRYCNVSDMESELIRSPAAPIVLLERLSTTVSVEETPPLSGRSALARSSPRPRELVPEVAPGVRTLGFMLPNTPLHHLLLKRMDRPIVLTSGNLSDEPQAIDRREARNRLMSIAEYFLEHDRPIARRVDDSVARVVAGRSRIIRRARGYAPAPLELPPGFEAIPQVMGFGGELKNTFCMLSRSGAVLSPHSGDLQNALTRADYRKSLADLREFFQFDPDVLACDLHPDYSSTRLARAEAENTGKPYVSVQHHHAHIAACLVENSVSRHAPPVLGIALDGMGFGPDGTFWGGEFLLADYAGYRRLATFRPIPLLGGEAVMHEPWRSTYAHLVGTLGWAQFAMNYRELDLFDFLERKPRKLLDGMIAHNVNAPLASSCGRLFDAVAAAAGLAREAAHFEGQGAVELEAAVDRDCLEHEDKALDYPFTIPRLPNGLPYVEPLAMWQAVLGDLVLRTPVGVIAARFHRGLAGVIVRMAEKLAQHAPSSAPPLNTVALSGGVFQNRILFERVLGGLEAKGFTVLTHSRVPANDGGIALGQAAIAAAQRLQDH